MPQHAVSAISTTTAIFVWVLLVLVLVGVVLGWCQPRHHAQEPVVIAQRIPYFGHVVGIVRFGLGYYQYI